MVLLKQGQSFGELALIKDQPRAASILCREDCDFMVLNKENYDNIIGVQLVPTSICRNFMLSLSFGLIITNLSSVLLNLMAGRSRKSCNRIILLFPNG